MEIIEPGHIYRLADSTGGEGGQTLTFVNREGHGKDHPGTLTQEVLRALIDRTIHCDNCLRWPGNDQIVYHLRMALVLHEARALERAVEKGELAPEVVEIGSDGHFALTHRVDTEAVWDARRDSRPVFRTERGISL